MNGVEFLACTSLEFVENYKGSLPEDRERLLAEFIDNQLKFDENHEVKVEFSPDWDWFNVSRPLNFSSDLDNKLVVLDFFTYCCINCLHILPTLHQLEKDHSIEDGLVIVGVHSAKFENERQADNIAAALERHRILHPVVNDGQLQLWNQLGITCWPTIVIIGPGQRPILQLVGEADVDLVSVVTAAVLRRLRGQLGAAGLPVSPTARLAAAGPLRFPGKLCVLHGHRLVISDSGHHRLLVTDSSGAVLRVIGGPTPGYRDGRLGEAKFSGPQGVAAVGDVVYVADTENHAVRKVDLAAGWVETIAGTGRRGSDTDGGGDAHQAIASPWDVCIAAGQLYVAMAGLHQIWTIYLHHGLLLGRRDCVAGTVVRLAGSGHEANRNNSYPHRAAFAQPSGVTWDAAGGRLLVADSESSSVRQVALDTGAVRAVVGGARDPTDLFGFGDVDSGDGAVLLQHPMGVAWSAAEGALYVADTYNHKVKRVQPEGKRWSCHSVTGGRLGDNVGPMHQARFNEPSDVVVEPSGDVLVVDSGNHCIKRLCLSTDTVHRLDVRMPHDTPDRPDEFSASGVFKSAGGDISVQIELLFSGVALTEGAPHNWKFYPLPDGWSAAPSGGCLPGQLSCRLTPPSLVSAGRTALMLRLRLFLCSPAGLCFPRAITLKLEIETDETAAAAGPLEARLLVTADSAALQL